MTDTFNPSEWMTTAEAAELTGYHMAHIRRLIRGGQIKGAKFGRDWMVSRESVTGHLQEMKSLGTSKHNPWRNKKDK